MKKFVLIFLFLFFSSSLAIDKIVIKGSKMFNNRTGEQFWVKGVAYAPKEFPLDHDPLADVSGIKRDIVEFQRLGVNTIRVYQSFVANNHDEVMQLLEDAGIYVILDIMDPLNAINRDSPSWTTTLAQVLFEKIDEFATHANLLAIIAGNEVTNQASNSQASTYTKACIRDVKSFIKQRGYQIPVGYATADAELVSEDIQDFFDCGEDTSAKIDFYGINTYRWCGNSSFTTSSFDVMTKTFSTWDVPVILTEFGCIIVENHIRPFTEIGSIFGPDMENVFSGGIAYEYATSSRGYGLVTINEDDSITELQDFLNLKDQLSKVVVQNGVTMQAYNPQGLQAQPCPAVTESWAASPILPPAVDAERCSCLSTQFTCRTVITDVSQADSIGKQLEDFFGTLCGTNPEYCKPISADGTQGVYGQFSMCDALTRASLALNYHYQAIGECDINGEGLAQVVKPTFVNQSGNVCADQYGGDSVSLSDIITLNSTPIDTVLPSVGTSKGENTNGTPVNSNDNGNNLSQIVTEPGTTLNSFASPSTCFSMIFLSIAILMSL